MKRHDVSTFVIYAAWTTTYYPQGAAPKVACHWAMDFIPFREVSPMSISFRMVHYYLLLTTSPCILLSNTKFCVILCVCKFFAILCLRLPSMKKSKKVRFLTRLGGIWISRKYVVYLYREKEILPQRGYLLHFCPIFWVKKGKITRHMRKNMCRTI